MIAEDVRNGPSDEASEALLAAPSGRRASPASSAPPTIRASPPGVPPSPSSAPSRVAIPCSAEALLARVLKGGELPRINALVDTYNAVSVRHLIPVGGEDLDRLEAICAWCARRTARSSGATTKA